MPRQNRDDEQGKVGSDDTVNEEQGMSETQTEGTFMAHEDDIPEGFDTPSGGNEFTHDDDAADLSGFSLDQEETAKDREMLSAPTGDYLKVGRKPWTYEHDFLLEDRKKGDRSKKGRLFIKFAGPVQNDEWKGMIQFRVSPDKRYAIDFQTKKIDENRFDSMYRLWLMAEEYYIQKVGEAPTNVKEVIDLLSKDDEIVLRIVKGREIGTGSFVMGFKAS